MADEWQTEFTSYALAQIDDFIAAHPGYTRQGVAQPGHGATNRVTFARHGDDIVVFKVFCEAERKERECYGLRHWHETGLVPKLIWDAGPRMIVISHVPGTYLHTVRAQDGDALWREACRTTGRAAGALTQVPLSPADRAAVEARFYGELGALEAYLGRILELAWRINARDPSFGGEYWRTNLDFIESQMGRLLSEPRVLYHQDVANLHVRCGQFIGFFDLEMCRVGGASLQLAAALGVFVANREGWSPFLEGWEEATSAALSREERRSAAAASYLLAWREISRYFSYDGTPGTGYAWASPAEPTRYRRAIEGVNALLGVAWG